MGFCVWFEELFQEKRRDSFLGGQMDMQESRKDKQMRIKNIPFYTTWYYSEIKGVMKRAVKWTSTDVDERRPLTGWKIAVWLTLIKKSAVASTSTVDGQRL